MSASNKDDSKSKVSGQVVKLFGADLETNEVFVLEPRPMPEFVEPAFSRAGGKGFTISNPYIRGGQCVFLEEKHLRELAEWVLSGGMDES
jgi:hypothetical protein